jgi:hypothetical protein
VFHETSLFRAFSGAFARPHRASVVAKTSLRGNEGSWRRGSLSGGIWGSTFSDEANIKHRNNLHERALWPVESEQLALFRPIGGELNGQPHQPLRAKLRRVFSVDDGRDDIGCQRRKTQ